MFSSGKRSAGRAAAGRSGTGGLSIIGGDVTVSGDVSSTGQLHIDGRVNGDVKCETLIQGDGGTISGHIDADTAHLAGLVDGTVKARVVTLEPSARVTGDVSYETLSIAAGATIEGRLARKDASIVLPPAPELKKANGQSDKPVKADAPGLLAMGAGAGATGA
jgi:cytoskeletal protein CcmA (bactofilin family)